jgi:tetratricopeptide (TPR) repeat protein
MHNLRPVLALAVVALLTLAAHQRNEEWDTLLAMWQDCAAKSPDKSRTRNNLGNCYILLQRHFSAIAEYERAVALDPGNLEAQFNLAFAYDGVGLYNQAMRPYEVFCRMAPPAYAEQKDKACSRLRELLDRARQGSGGP